MDLLDCLTRAGVVGAGGAGFPTGKKLDCKAEVLLLNGAECEPLLETDKLLMRTKAKEIVRGARQAGEWIGAKRILIVLKKKYAMEAQALQRAIDEANAPIQLFPLDSFYPAGDEHVMVFEALGRTVPPSGIPIQVGAVVSNVCTMYWAGEALSGKPVTDRYLSVLGEVRSPCVVRAPIGTPLRECVEGAGGALIKGFRAIIGGPMMGKFLTPEDLADAVVTKTTGGIILVKEDSSLAQKKELSLAQALKRAKSACIQCTFCTEQCPRRLIGHPIRPHLLMRQMAYGGSLSEMRSAHLCSECGVCENYSCPMGLSPRQVNVHIKGLLRKASLRYEPDGKALCAPPFREYRKLPAKRLATRLGVAAYEFHSGDDPVLITPSAVRIPLSQHIGAPAKAAVAPGERVNAGQVIGEMEAGKLGAYIHASIGGTVTEVTDAVCIVSDKAVIDYA